MGVRMLLLGVYGMEMVECGGALALNVKNGGQSFASIMLAGEQTKKDVTKAAEVLGVEKVYFGDFVSGEVDFDRASKVKLVRVIREVKPDIIITQDPEHCQIDLDPDRRPAMTLIQESIALASRAWALDETPGLEPHPIPTIYYMSPLNPNCILNVASVWKQKEGGMDVLESQMNFSGHHYENTLAPEELEVICPGFAELPTYYEKGRRVHAAVDRALHMYHGICGHGTYALAEHYRREGQFEFMELPL